MKIQRQRYVITRRDRTEIFCGTGNIFKFKPIAELGRTAVKTYWNIGQINKGAVDMYSGGEPIEILKVLETYEVIE